MGETPIQDPEYRSGSFSLVKDHQHDATHRIDCREYPDLDPPAIFFDCWDCGLTWEVGTAPAQDPEYLREAHEILCEKLARWESAQGSRRVVRESTVDAILDALASHGWHLINAEDYERLVGAYTLQEIRGGRVTTTELDERKATP